MRRDVGQIPGRRRGFQKHRPLIGLVDPQEHLRETIHLIVVTPLRKGEIKLRKSLAIVHSALIAADL